MLRVLFIYQRDRILGMKYVIKLQRHFALNAWRMQANVVAVSQISMYRKDR